MPFFCGFFLLEICMEALRTPSSVIGERGGSKWTGVKVGCGHAPTRDTPCMQSCQSPGLTPAVLPVHRKIEQWIPQWRAPCAHTTWPARARESRESSARGVAWGLHRPGRAVAATPCARPVCPGWPPRTLPPRTSGHACAYVCDQPPTLLISNR